MFNINRHNREDIEEAFMALLFNKTELLDVIQVIPKYLFNKDHQILLKAMLEDWNSNEDEEFVDLERMCENYPKLRTEEMALYCVHLKHNVLWMKKAYKRQLEIAEESIVKFYKEDLIKKLNKKLTVGEINYDEFVNKTKELDEIKLTHKAETLTREVIEMNYEENSIVNFKNYPKFSDNLKLTQNDLMVVGSTTGSGKTSFMLNLMNDLMTEYQCIYFNLEMSPSLIYKRVVAINSNLRVYDIGNYKTDYQKGKADKAIDVIEENGLIIEHEINDVQEVKSFISKVKDSSKHTIIFIDHVGLLKIKDKKSLYEQTTANIKELRKICLEYDCTIITASQLNRSAYTADDFSLSMLKDSGELENSARKIVLMHKDKKSPKDSLDIIMNIEIAKNDNGLLGVIKMDYDKQKQIFKEKSDIYVETK